MIKDELLNARSGTNLIGVTTIRDMEIFVESEIRIFSSNATEFMISDHTKDVSANIVYRFVKETNPNNQYLYKVAELLRGLYASWLGSPAGLPAGDKVVKLLEISAAIKSEPYLDALYFAKIGGPQENS